MTERKPGNEDGVDFVERQRQKSNASKREKLEVTSNGFLLYPEEKIEITVEHALELAKVIVLDNDPDSEGSVLRRGKINFGMDKVALASQREQAGLMSNMKLLMTIELQEKSPGHYSKERIFAVAEALIHKLDSTAK